MASISMRSTLTTRAMGKEGKGIPLLGYEEWLEDVVKTELVYKILRMNRCEPIHPEPKLPV